MRSRTGGAGGNATFQFDVPVRFDIDKLDVEIQDFATDEFASIVRKIPLIEVRLSQNPFELASCLFVPKPIARGDGLALMTDSQPSKANWMH
jgi:hypothetical protein